MEKKKKGRCYLVWKVKIMFLPNINWHCHNKLIKIKINNKNYNNNGVGICSNGCTENHGKTAINVWLSVHPKVINIQTILQLLKKKEKDFHSARTHW